NFLYINSRKLKNMKKKILIAFLFGTSSLFAQQIDSILAQDLAKLKNSVIQQNQKTDSLIKEIDSQKVQFEHVFTSLANQKNALGQQKVLIDTLQNKNIAQKATIDSLKNLIQTN